MPKKISQLESAIDVTASDLVQIVDIEDVDMAASGTNKKCTAQLLANELGKISSITSTGSSTSRKLIDRFADVVNVKDFGAVGDGVADDTAAFQAAADFAGTGNPIFVPSGNYLKSTIVNESDYFWICDEALNSLGTNPISLIGHVEQAFSNRRLIKKTTTTPNEFTELQLIKSFNYSGGTAGWVSSTQHVSTAVSKDVDNFVWGIVSVLNNSAEAGENVAIYGQGNRVANNGPVWGGVFEAKDLTNTDGTGKGGTVGIEVDVFANGADVNGNRVGVDVVIGKGVSGGAACQATAGVRVVPQGNSTANATVIYGFHARGCTAVDFLAQSESYAAFNGDGTNTFGLLLSGTHQVGIDTSTATITNKAIRIAAGQQIAFNATGTITMEYDSASTSILLKNSGVTKHTFSMV